MIHGRHEQHLLLSDPQIAAIPVAETGEPLVEVGHGVLVRAGLARRLARAALRLPDGLRLCLVEGFRSPSAQQDIIDAYRGSLQRLDPSLTTEELRRLTSRYVAPLDVAPHVAGAAVDLTLADRRGVQLDLGCPIDATPEQSAGACYFAASNLDPAARRLRAILAEALGAEGLVNYPTEWWHWSYGDRYWAVVTGHHHALYGPAPVALRDPK